MEPRDKSLRDEKDMEKCVVCVSGVERLSEKVMLLVRYYAWCNRYLLERICCWGWDRGLFLYARGVSLLTK